MMDLKIERTVLAIESSCDETAVAIVRGDGKVVEVLSSEISSQINLHREYGGVVPELASRNHSLVLRPLVEIALANAGLGVEQIDCFAATGGPGLASSLLIGHTAAKAMAAARRRPFVSVNHMEGHLLSPFIESDTGVQPNVALVVSGGHTMILSTKEFGDYDLLGKTLDDAAGEAFDKVAKMLGLPYPGGPEIEKMAVAGNPKAFQFPRSVIKQSPLDFSFSGLKTAVLYTLADIGSEKELSLEQLSDVCASFQQAVIDVLVEKTLRAASDVEAQLVTVSGGVSCNQALRKAFQQACATKNLELKICSPALSTDNATMIAYTALHKHIGEVHQELTCDVNPNMPLNEIKLR